MWLPSWHFSSTTCDTVYHVFVHIIGAAFHWVWSFVLNFIDFNHINIPSIALIGIPQYYYYIKILEREVSVSAGCHERVFAWRMFGHEVAIEKSTKAFPNTFQKLYKNFTR
jgi:hypothetical protein